jgi:hypothetical protein
LVSFAAVSLSGDPPEFVSSITVLISANTHHLISRVTRVFGVSDKLDGHAENDVPHGFYQD